MSARGLLIRAVETRDAAALADIYNHYVRVSPATFDTDEKTVEERTAWLTRFSSEGPHRCFVACAADGEIEGYCCSHEFRTRPAYAQTVETAIYVRHGRGRRGTGAQLYAALFDALAEARVHRAVAGLVIPNAASVGVHEKAGFRRIGVFSDVGFKFGRYWDVAFYEKPLIFSSV